MQQVHFYLETNNLLVFRQMKESWDYGTEDVSEGPMSYIAGNDTLTGIGEHLDELSDLCKRYPDSVINCYYNWDCMEGTAYNRNGALCVEEADQGHITSLSQLIGAYWATIETDCSEILEVAQAYSDYPDTSPCHHRSSADGKIKITLCSEHCKELMEAILSLPGNHCTRVRLDDFDGLGEWGGFLIEGGQISLL